MLEAWCCWALPGPSDETSICARDQDLGPGKAKPYEFIGLGAMHVTKPYEFIRFGAMDVTKPYGFIGFGAMDVTKSYEFIGFGAMDA